MNVQDTAFKFTHPLRVRISQKFIKNKKRSNTEVSLLFWRAARDTGGKPPCVLGDRRMATVPASHFATKNSPLDCFLNVAHPLRVRIPQKFIKKREAIPKYHFSFGALQGIRTPDLLVRSQTLYPAELAAHFLTLIYYSTEF